MLGPEKTLGLKKLWVQNISVQKHAASKNNFGPKNLGQKKILVQTDFRS